MLPFDTPRAVSRGGFSKKSMWCSGMQFHFPWPQAHWPPHCPSNLSGDSAPIGAGCSFCLECSLLPTIWLTPSLSSGPRPKVTFSFGFHDHPVDNLTLIFLIPSTCLIFTPSTYHHPIHCIINLKKKIQSFVCSCWNICFMRAGFFHLGKCPKEDRYSLLFPVAGK